MILWRVLATILWALASGIVLGIALVGGALVMLAAELIPAVRWLARQGDGA